MNLNRLTPLALVLACAPITAQETTGTLVGTARAKSGKVLQGALVQLSSPKLLGTRTTTTDAKGDFRIPLLPTGTYTITFSSKGYFTSRGTFNLLAGQVLRQDGLLREESTQEAEVTVISTPAQVDKTDTVTQTAMAVETLQTIFPASDLTALVSYSPGVSGGGEAPSIRGGIGVGTNVLMNGGSVKSMVKNLYEMRTTIPDMVESVAVIQSPLNAKIGSTDGGAIAYTTSRGSNDWSGSVRRTGLSRNFWYSASQYPNKLGQISNRQQAPDGPDNVGGEWQITLKGPILTDRLTFAYGGVLTPNTIGRKMWSKSVSDIPQPTDTASTFFRDPSNGQVFRQAQLSPYDGKFTPMENVNTWNQYNLYWQINTNHQLEYGYTKQFGSSNIENGAWFGGDPGLPLGTFETTRTFWNVGYKGVIGKSGLLEVRLAQKKEAYVHATTKEPGIFTWRGQNNVPDLTDSGNGDLRPANDPIELWYWNTPGLMENGRSYGDHDTLSTLSDSINYQHVLDAAGTHVIDVGMNDLGAKYENLNSKDLNFRTFGRLSTGISDPGYAGKYIVIPYNATVGDLTGGSDWSYDGASISAGTLWRNAPGWLGPSSIMSTMWKNSGPGNGISRTNNRAFYINDQWTLNENHSVMMGLRLDRFKVWDDYKTIHSYSQFTPRFEYKWDVKGDQKRIFNFSYGQFAETMHSVYFLPYTQSYLPYGTRQYWTGAADPSPYKSRPNAPYLVSATQLMNPANYSFIPGFSTFSMSGGANEQLDPSLRGPVSTEYTLGFRRAFDNGSYYRIAYIHRSWKNLFDYFPAPAGVTQSFPQDYFPGAAPTQVLPRILANDPQAHRTYKGVELEWNFLFTQRFTFGGNYTYSRMTANDSGGTLENPMAQGKGGSTDRNWRDYLNTFVPAAERNPEALRAGGHAINAWMTWDLTTGKLKQSLVLRGRYWSGSPYSNGQSFNIARPTVPGYNDATYTNQAGLPTTVTRYYGGIQQFFTTDGWSSALRYNIEAPVYRKLVWFCSFDIPNWLNHMRRTGYTLSAGGYSAQNWRTDGIYAALAGGPRFGNRDTRGAEGFTGARSISLETGFRF